MKNFTIVVLLFISVKLFAQFPAPSNFSLQYTYILLGEDGFCNGTHLIGPNYCFKASLAAPDLVGIPPTLLFYKLYMNSNCVDTLYSLFQQGVNGGIGEFYVTAYYTNPEGESLPSNKVTVADLPIFSEQQKYIKLAVFYNAFSSQINIQGNEDLNHYRIFDSLGKIVQHGKLENNSIGFSVSSNGIYFIELSGENNQVYRKKIIVVR